MLAVLCKLVRDEKKVHLYLETLEDLGLERIGNGREVLRSAASLASQYRLSGYDAIYAACASTTGGVWVTADRDAHRRIAGLKISRAL